MISHNKFYPSMLGTWNLTLTPEYDSTTLRIIAAKASGGYYLYVCTIKYRTDLICYGVCKFKAFDVADPYFTLCKAVFFKLFYDLIDHPVISTAFSDLFNSTIIAGCTKYFNIHKADCRRDQFTYSAILSKIMQ